MKTFPLISVLAMAACSPTVPRVEQEPAPSPPAPPIVETAPSPDPAPKPVEPEATPEPDPATRAEAERRYEQGHEMFRQGRYDQAELELKEALNLYPFMAEANLVLGKVFLIRGAAARDQVLINSARLMFKMANSIDPSLREAGILLGLFTD
ncbi:MAG: hypothetical protein AAFX94_07560 [Myxococcota bacterium]